MRKKIIKTNEVVVYGNKIQTIKLANLNPLEQNLLFSVFKELRYKDEYTFSIEQVEAMMNKESKSMTNTEYFTTLIKKLPKKFLGTNILIEDEKSKLFVNLFSYLLINVEQDNIKSISIGVNKDFSYLFRDLTSNFMSFDLNIFKKFKSVYTKTIYRYINQYSALGQWKINYNDFIDLLDIPTTYDFKLVNYRILKPSIKEISGYIDGLKYRIIKERENKKLVIKYIVFEFKKFKNSITQDKIIPIDKELKRTLFGIKIIDKELNKILVKCNEKNIDKIIQKKNTLKEIKQIISDEVYNEQ